MPDTTAWAVLRHRNFRNFLFARFLASLSMMMLSVAVGWQVYDLTRDPFALGIVGLVQFIPAFLTALPGGQAADRFERRKILLFAIALQLVVAAALFFVSQSERPSVHVIYAILVLVGVARSFSMPASQSLVPMLVPAEHFPRAVAWASSSFEAATIAGPAIGGFLYVFGPATVYGISTLLLATALVLVARMKVRLHARSAAGLAGILAGVRFVWGRKEILGAISLDLFAVLLGGATALLPVYARDILHTGPWGLGLLRSAPAVGAVCMALWLAHHPLHRRAGTILYLCIAGFGVFTIVFGLSKSFPLSLFALLCMGAFDMVSVVVRQTLTQIRTPDGMRGRVSAINMVFIGASNELGEFESGVTAGLFGTVPAVVLGGIGTIVVVGIWSFLFPQLRRIDRLDEASG